MSDHADFTAFVCTQCGLPLVGPSGELHAKPDEMVSCPVHGPVGSLKDLLQGAGPEATRNVSEEIAKALKNVGFDF